MIAIVAVLLIGPVLMEVPTIGMDFDFDAVRLVINLVGMPAIALRVADDTSGCDSGRSNNGATANKNGNSGSR